MSANPFDDEAPMNIHEGAGIDLSAFDDEFEEAEAPDFEQVPDGKYQVRVNKAQLAKSSAGDPMIRWDLIVISGPQEGRHIFKNAVISQKSLPYVKGDLTKLGLKLGRLSDLPNHIEQALDQTLEVTVRTKGDFTNCYFNRLLSIPSGAGGNPGAPW